MKFRFGHPAHIERLIALACICVAAGCSDGNDGGNIDSAADVAATLQTYCSDCHNPAEFSGELSVTGLDADAVHENAADWERIVRRLRTRTMPPAEAPRPSLQAYEQFATWVEDALDESVAANPGAPALRRLNRAEYANAIRDLLNLQIDVSALLPPDDSAFGFDNIGDLLVFSPTLLERYLAAADRVSALAVGDPATAPGAQTYVVRGDQSQATHLEGLPLGTVGGLAVTHNFPLDAVYEFSLELFRNNLEVIRGLEHPHQVEIAIDGRQVLLEDIGGEAEVGRAGTTINELSDSTDARLRVAVPVEAGPRLVTVAFIRKIAEGAKRLRPFERSNAGTYDGTGRPHLETVTITGPFEATGPGDTPSRRRIFSCRPAADVEARTCATEILTRLARRAYRRPVDAADVARLMEFFDEGYAAADTDPASADDGYRFDSGIQLALRRMLASPAFAFRFETQPDELPIGQAYDVSDVELASRLSFFLWSTIPDETLLSLAEAGQLSDPATLESEVRRMLADPKSAALVENFAGQWLHLRNLDNINPNSDAFPDFDNNLREAFRREAELLFASIVAEDRSVLDLMTADYTFVNERLAKHYGIPHVYGSHFRRVELGPEFAARRGLLGKGGILMATSHADRTAPSLRGKWVLENLLGSPPPAPPANVPALETEVGSVPQTIRDRLEMHRGSPACAGCHQLIDPLGFAMENFDAIGAWRTLDAGRAVDAHGQLLDGTAVDGAAELREALLSDPRVFAGTLTEKLLIYALGRGLQYYDMPVVRSLLRDAQDSQYRFSDIVLGIVRSTPFRQRIRVEGATEGA